MKPRWLETALRGEDAEFLGGYDRYDLWLMNSRVLRVVWGVATSEWDTYYNPDKEFYHKEAGRPRGEDLAMVLQYVRLFAPDAAIQLELGDAITPEGETNER